MSSNLLSSGIHAKPWLRSAAIAWLLAAACSPGAGSQAGSLPDNQAAIDIAAGDFMAAATVGGVATPSSYSWAVDNPSSLTYEYALQTDQPWVQVQGASTGSIAPSQQTTFEVALNAVQVAALPVGVHSATLEVRNATANRLDAVRSIVLNVSTNPTTPSSGWTPLTASTDTRKVHVSSSTGNDANDGLSEQTPKRTIAAAMLLIRNGFPDWLVLKKGDSWTESIGNWGTSGRSATEPQVITSYGTGPRPQLRTGGSTGLTGMGGGQRAWLSIVDIHFRGRDNAPASQPIGLQFLTPVRGLLIEGCLVERYLNGIVVQGFDGRFPGVSLRRNVVVDCYSVDGAHSGGTYLSGIDGLLIEENIFDHNGWLPEAPGATPPTIFRHNVYIQNDNTGVVVRGNFVLSAASNGLSQRSGGIAEDNVLARNSIAMLMGGFGGSGFVRRNVIMEGKDIDANNPRGWGIDCTDIVNGVVEKNLLTNNPNCGGPVGIAINNPNPVNGLRIEGNRIYNWRAGIGFHGPISSVSGIRLIDNQIQDNLSANPLIQHVDAANTASVVESRGNRLYRSQGSANWIRHGFNEITIGSWQGLVSDSTSSMQQIAYPDPTRNLASYHGSLGRTATHEAFVTELRRQSKDFWRAEYSARTVADWIRAGFDMTVD